MIPILTIFLTMNLSNFILPDEFTLKEHSNKFFIQLAYRFLFELSLTMLASVQYSDLSNQPTSNAAV